MHLFYACFFCSREGRPEARRLLARILPPQMDACHDANQAGSLES